MGKKRSGHYCRACGRYRSNEKFSGKGHRQHICKDCKKASRIIINQSSENEGFRVHQYECGIKNCLILFTDRAKFMLFEYSGEMYFVNTDFHSNIYRYEETLQPPLVSANEFYNKPNIIDDLMTKYYSKLENGEYIDYYDILNEIEWNLTVNQQKYLELILAIEDYSNDILKSY